MSQALMPSKEAASAVSGALLFQRPGSSHAFLLSETPEIWRWVQSFLLLFTAIYIFISLINKRWRKQLVEYFGAHRRTRIGWWSTTRLKLPDRTSTGDKISWKNTRNKYTTVCRLWCRNVIGFYSDKAILSQQNTPKLCTLLMNWNLVPLLV